MTELDRRTLRLLEAAASWGGRCPKASDGADTHTVVYLARAGLIRIDLYGQNWRVITILTGTHAGQSTKLPPHGGTPWKTIDKSGSHLNTKMSRAVRARPSAPRPFNRTVA